MTIHLRHLPTLDDRIDAATVIHNRWRDRLRALPGVTGTAVSVETDGEVCVSVYATVYAIVPSDVEGVRVVRRKATERRPKLVPSMDAF